MLYKKLRHSIVERLNAYIKRTNWWKNHFLYTSQFLGGNYRDNLIRNLQIVNVGSNSARFCFFYENVLGQNWSTGSQGLKMDFEILKYNHSYIVENGVVLIPLSPFSFLSAYLITKPNHYNYDYYVKYTKVLDPIQINELPCAKDIWGFRKSPIRYNHKAWKYLINDVQLDKSLDISDQPMMLAELMQDANLFIGGWKNEFEIADLSASLPEHLVSAMDKSVALLSEIIDFCKERGYRPTIVLPPMTKVLHDKFPQSFWQTYVYEGITKLNRSEVPVLDYMHDEKWADASLYFNCYFMNLRGRKAFSKQVLKDTGIKIK